MDQRAGTTAVSQDPDGDSNLFAYGLRFPGQYFDGETGLHYNVFRDYDPVVGRYLESDPIGLKGGPNTFNYAESNSVDTSDQNGLQGQRSRRRAGWVECSGGKLVPHIEELPPHYWRCGIADCFLVHERTHVFDMTRSGQDVQCRFLPPGIPARMGSAPQSESNAYAAELVCLVMQQRRYTNCQDCWHYIEDRIRDAIVLKHEYEALFR